MHLSSKPLTEESGFSLIELLVSLGLGLLFSAMVASTVQMSRNLYLKDNSRSQVVENLEAAMTYIGTNLIQAGEVLPGNFPVIELIDGGPGVSDTLRIRKNTLDDIPFLCRDAPAGETRLRMAREGAGGTLPACFVGNAQQTFQNWDDFRIANGGSVRAFLYDVTTKEGEFFDLVDVDARTFQLHFIAGAGITRDYPEIASNFYMIEEFLFEVVGQELTVQENDDGILKNIASGVDRMEVTVKLMDSATEVDSFGPGENWQNIEYVRVQLEGSERINGETYTTSLEKSFFPRNIMSR